jgi:DNA polymerase-4
VVPWTRERSVGSQETLSLDTDQRDVVSRELLRMADKTARRMRKQGVLGRTVVLCLRFADFREITRAVTVDSPTDVGEEIHAAVMGTYDRLGLDRARIRRVGVRMEGLVDESRAHRQPRLTDPEFGWREAEHAIDQTVARFGPGAVRRAVLGGSRRATSVAEANSVGLFPLT